MEATGSNEGGQGRKLEGYEQHDFEGSFDVQNVILNNGNQKGQGQPGRKEEGNLTSRLSPLLDQFSRHGWTTRYQGWMARWEVQRVQLKRTKTKNEMKQKCVDRSFQKWIWVWRTGSKTTGYL
jgi:hypothetical protein